MVTPERWQLAHFGVGDGQGRIIDLSEHAAELLGYKTAGTARVRVQFVSRADLDGCTGPCKLRAAGRSGRGIQ